MPTLDPSADPIEEVYDALMRYVVRLVRDPILAQDVVQEVCVRFQEKGRDVPPERRRAWLYRVARNLVIDTIRKRRDVPGDLDPDFLPGEATRYDPSLLCEKKETKAMLLQKLNELPPRQREVVRLKFQEGLSYAEIADVTRQTRTTVGWLLHQAMIQLRNSMKGARS